LAYPALKCNADGHKPKTSQWPIGCESAITCILNPHFNQSIEWRARQCPE